MERWYNSKVVRGKGIGKSLGFPTLNLINTSLLRLKKTGVYTSLIKINSKIYKGLLYYGPRLVIGEKYNIIEIYVINFDKEIYGKTVRFTLLKYLRGIINFTSFDQMKNQLQQDILEAHKIFKNLSKNNFL